MSPNEFSRHTLPKKLQLLRLEGDFVGTRDIPSYTVSLFAFHGFYVELYVLKSLNQVQWIELQNNAQILSEYANNVDLNDLF